MASKKSKLSVDLSLLSLIAAATNGGNFHYVTKEEGEPLLAHNPPLIEVNTNMIENGKAAARTTAAGNEMVGNLATQAAAPIASTSPYAIIKGVALPPKGVFGRRSGGGAPKQYPFDTMDVGDSFFVPVSEKHKNPVKTLGSTVTSANMRFATKTDETKTQTRKQRGKDRKALVGADGQPVMETVQVPVYKLTKKFEIRAVEAGKTYGEWTASESGAVIARVQ